MRCPHCTAWKTYVLKTEQPMNEGVDTGNIKKRTRKCRECAKNFVTFEIHEFRWRGLPKVPPLERRPLLNEATNKPPTRPNITG